MTSRPQPARLSSFWQFDKYLASLIGRYLGGTITAEEVRRRIGAARNQCLDDEILPWPRPDQHWRYDDDEPATPEGIVHSDFEFFAPNYTLGPRPERPSDYDPGEYPEEGLRRRIIERWIPQLQANYGPDVIPVVVPDDRYVDRRSALVADLAETHRRYIDGLLTGPEFIDAVYAFRALRDAEDVHHYQFEAAIWDAGVLSGAVIDSSLDAFEYEGRGPARRRLEAILDAFPELS